MIYKISLDTLKYCEYMLIFHPNSGFFMPTITFPPVPPPPGEADLAEQQRDTVEKMEKASVGKAADIPASDSASVRSTSWECLTALSGDGELVLILFNIGSAVSLHSHVQGKTCIVLFMSPKPSRSPVLLFLG